MTPLDDTDPQICRQVEAHPERFLVQIRFFWPKDTKDGPLVNAATWRNAFHESCSLSQSALDYFLVVGWTHCFFWGMTNRDRAFMLGSICGIPKTSLTPCRNALKS